MRLRLIREYLGYQIDTVANYLGIKIKKLKDIEEDKEEPDKEILERLSRLYKCTIEYMTSNEPFPKDEVERFKEYLRNKRK